MKDATAELVRINDKGEAHPIGVAAGKHLRSRRGTYRLLPAPQHLVFMRLCGDDGERDAGDGALVRLAGEIGGPGALCDVLAMLGHTRWAGELVVFAPDGCRSIFLDYGNAVGATTTVTDERLGSLMYRYGALDEALLNAILTRVKSGARFGEVVVELGLATEQQVYGFLGRQIQEIVFAALAVDEGTFFFLDGFGRDQLASHHSISVSSLLMEGVTRLDEIRYFRRAIPSDEWIPACTDRAEEPPEELEPVYMAVDGQRSVAEIGRLTGIGEFETTKALYGLVQSKHVEMCRPRRIEGPESVVAAANDVLRVIHERLDGAGLGVEFRQRLDGFAVGAGVYDILFHGAGPQEDGSLEPDVVARNVGHVAGGDPEEFLRAKLREYISFALFSAGNALGAETERALSQQLGDVLGSLQPRG